MKHGHGMIELRAADLIVGEEAQPLPKKRRKPRRPSIAGALAQARKVGATVKAATIAVDGSVTVMFGPPEPIADLNPWDVEEAKLKGLQ
jgi:hypothetical protein